jgi:hypothetical protein
MNGSDFFRFIFSGRRLDKDNDEFRIQVFSAKSGEL